MALSQFEPKLTVPRLRSAERRSQRTITVGGPLEIAAPEDYEHPIRVQFQVVQVPRGEHDDRSGRETRARHRQGGFNEAGQIRWRGTVKLGAA